MGELTSKEKVLKFMLTKEMNIRLSTSDYRVAKNILMKTTVTSNQNQLIDLLINKYAAAIKKAGQNPTQLLKLPWAEKTIIQSDSTYSIPRVCLKGNILRIFVPYLKGSNSAAKLDFSRGYEWDDQTKEYYELFTTERLKHVLGLVEKHYKQPPHLCPEIKRLLADADKYKGFYTPTLVRSNDNFFIAGHNQHLEKAISSISLNDDPSVLSKLVRHGVEIDATVHKGNKIKVLASQLIIKINQDELEETVLILYNMGIRRFSSSQRMLLSEINDALPSRTDAQTFMMSSNTKSISDAVLVLDKSMWIAEHSLRLGFYKVVVVQ